MRNRTLVIAGATLTAVATVAIAQETTTHSYDALGRLTSTTISGGPNNNRQIGTCFDRAGNRLRYDVATATPSPCPTPTG